ncbi:MAG: hypothetical protein FWE34_06500 [Defluviitaleaceae bacterium]|nr:hypothetical protein [Defluviitaleaceae bacterium]
MSNAKRVLAAISLALLMIGLAACDIVTNNSQYGLAEEGLANLPDEPDMPDWSNYPIIVNNMGIADNFFILDGEMFPTHVPLNVVHVLGLNTIQGGSQIAFERDGEIIMSPQINIINYLAGLEGFDIGHHDTFMTDDFHVYVPISLFKELGFNAYFSGGHVFIYDGESDMQ